MFNDFLLFVDESELLKKRYRGSSRLRLSVTRVWLVNFPGYYSPPTRSSILLEPYETIEEEEEEEEEEIAKSEREWEGMRMKAQEHRYSSLPRVKIRGRRRKWDVRGVHEGELSRSFFRKLSGTLRLFLSRLPFSPLFFQDSKATLADRVPRTTYYPRRWLAFASRNEWKVGQR